MKSTIVTVAGCLPGPRGLFGPYHHAATRSDRNRIGAAGGAVLGAIGGNAALGAVAGAAAGLAGGLIYD